MPEIYPAIAELLPHRGPAVLLDRVVVDTPDSIRTTVRIHREHPFFVPSLGVPVWVGIEMMAQAIAAHAGLAARREQRPPNAGMLLGTRRLQADAGYFPEGAELEVRAEREFGEPGGIAACACSILMAGQTRVTATIIIVEISEENRP